MIYKTKRFESKFKKSGLSDLDLVDACAEIDKGLVEANYGSFLYKKRVAMPSARKGKSGGYRVIVAARIGELFVFIYMFPKSERGNISDIEKVAMKEMAKGFCCMAPAQIEQLVDGGELIKVKGDQDERYLERDA